MVDKQIRILALATDAFGGYGGIARYNQDLISALSDNETVARIDVKIRVGDPYSETLPQKVNQHIPRLSRLRYAIESIGLALIRRPDIVFNLHLYHSPLSRMIAKFSGARLVSQLHGTETWNGISPRQLKALSASDLVFCVSRDTQSRILAQCPRLEGKTVVIPNTVQSRFKVGNKQAARRKFGLENEKTILTVARLDNRNGYKGHDKIISMLPELCQEHQDEVHYLIAGTGKDQPRLEMLARDLGVESKVSFLGRVADDDLPDLYRAADLFAMPSTGEGFGIVYLEAMASGTPAIGLDLGGTRDAFADGEIGGCVAPEDFARTLKEMLQAPPPNAIDLAQSVQARFGKKAFEAKVNDILGQSQMSGIL